MAAPRPPPTSAPTPAPTAAPTPVPTAVLSTVVLWVSERPAQPASSPVTSIILAVFRIIPYLRGQTIDPLCLPSPGLPSWFIGSSPRRLEHRMTVGKGARVNGLGKGRERRRKEGHKSRHGALDLRYLAADRRSGGGRLFRSKIRPKSQILIQKHLLKKFIIGII